MELTLVYKGNLPPRQRNVSAVKGTLRRAFHPQLEAQLRPRLGGKAEELGTSSIDGAQFFSPVHPRLHTAVDLHVLLLTPAHLSKHGDTDNRLKTLIDGLTRPQNSQQLADFDSDRESNVFCLLDDDRLVRRISIDSRTWHSGDLRSTESIAVVSAQIIISDSADGSSPVANLFLVLP